MKANRIILAAIALWKSRRPAHWTLEEHLGQPVVNMRGKEEHDLAEAIAEALKEKQK